MRESVKLVAAETRAGFVRWESAPRWVRPDDPEGYWHIPRSVAARKGDEQYELHVILWCGAWRRCPPEDLKPTPYPGARLCGTCDGRANGYERRAGLIFSPRGLFDAPKRCPALLAGMERRCPFCGGKASYRHGGWCSDQVPHKPGPLLADNAHPCPHHGWRFAVRDGSRIICKDWRFVHAEPCNTVLATLTPEASR